MCINLSLKFILYDWIKSNVSASMISYVVWDATYFLLLIFWWWRFERWSLKYKVIAIGDCEDASSNSILSWSLIKELYSWCYPRGNVIRVPTELPMHSNVRIIASFVYHSASFVHIP